MSDKRKHKLVWAYPAYDSNMGRIGLFQFVDEEGNAVFFWEQTHRNIPPKFDPESEEYDEA